MAGNSSRRGAIRKDGTQQNVVDLMQTRNELYEVIDNATYEETLDKLFGKGK